MNSVSTTPGRARRKATIVGVALVAFGLSIAAAPAAAADVTVCDGKGNCFTYRTLEPIVCKLEKIPEVDTTLKVTGCTGSVAGGRNPVVVSVSAGTGKAIIIGVPRCPPACGTGPTFPPPPSD